MRAFCLVGSLMALTLVALAPAAALASCAPPVSVAENAERADAVVYGRVTGYEGALVGPPSRFAIFQVEQVLKGSTGATIRVGIGPGTEGGPGQGPAATSVDYRMDAGTDHVLYLQQHAPDSYSTNACSGSHAGPPIAEEAAFFGQGTGPIGGSAGARGASDLDRGIAALASVLAVTAGIAVAVYAMRTRKKATTAV